jgi:hypothetical protein
MKVRLNTPPGMGPAMGFFTQHPPNIQKQPVDERLDEDEIDTSVVMRRRPRYTRANKTTWKAILQACIFYRHCL